jgi:putative aldouronate transport system substrate-binding protein
MADSGMAEAGAEFAITPIPKLNANDELLVYYKNYTTLVGGGTVVTTACEKPDYAVRFIDWFYSEEGSFIANYGIEGVTFNYNKDGKPVHTDLIAHNPDGMTSTYAQVRYLIHNGFMVFILDREEDVQSEAALKYRDLWSGVGKYNIMGTMYFTTDEGTERSAILNDINTYVGEFTLNAIQGLIDINNDSVWNEYVNTLKSQNIDRAVQITQDAYNRLMAR